MCTASWNTRADRVDDVDRPETGRRSAAGRAAQEPDCLPHQVECAVPGKVGSVLLLLLYHAWIALITRP